MKVGSVVTYFGEEYVVESLEYSCGHLAGVWCVNDSCGAEPVFFYLSDLD